MTQLPDIHSLHWQPALGNDGIVENLDDIHQAIRVILTTPVGSVPRRPDFGSNVWQYLDYPIDRARPHVVREAIAAIARWEPRITVTQIVVTVAELARCVLTVVWQVSDAIKAQTQVQL